MHAIFELLQYIRRRIDSQFCLTSRFQSSGRRGQKNVWAEKNVSVFFDKDFKSNEKREYNIQWITVICSDRISAKMTTDPNQSASAEHFQSMLMLRRFILTRFLYHYAFRLLPEIAFKSFWLRRFRVQMKNQEGAVRQNEESIRRRIAISLIKKY